MESQSNISKPPFVFTYWNPFDKDAPGLGQSFLNYVKDTSLVEYGAKLIGSNSQRSSEDFINAISNVKDDLVDVLEEEFRFLDQRLSRIEQGIINSNLLLENIIELLKLPDSEKQRQRHIELGIKFSNQSLKDSDISVDAVNEFEAALKLMPQDWFVLQQLGMLLLYSEKFQDVKRAKDCFLRSAKYASVDTLESSFMINVEYKRRYSLPYFDSDIQDTYDEDKLLESIDNDMPLKDFVQECYLNAALASYILTDYNEAVQYSKKALEVSSNNPKAQFFYSKYLARNGNSSDAILNLKRLIQQFPYMVEPISVDQDLKNLEEIGIMVANLSNTIPARLKTIKEKLQEAKSLIKNENIFKIIRELNEPIKIAKFYMLLEEPLNTLDKNRAISNKNALSDIDSLFPEAARLIVQHQQGSTSLIQRKLKLSYGRAGRLIDQLEAAGIVGEFDGSAARKVLIEDPMRLETLLDSLNGNFKSNLTLTSTSNGWFVVKDLETNWSQIKEILDATSRKETISKINSLKAKNTDLQESLKIKYKELSSSKEVLKQLGGFQLFRSSSDKNEQIKKQEGIIESLIAQIRNITNEMKKIEDEMNQIK